MPTQVDAYGRVIADLQEIEELVYAGLRTTDVLVEDSDAAQRFNSLLEQFDQDQYKVRFPEAIAYSPEEEHARRANEWLICDDLRDLPVREFLLEACMTDAQRNRVNDEMDLFEEKGLVPLLQTMICLVEHFRRNKIVWGVGRGSSVASYVLYLIGVHKIDSMKYGLSIREFLKDE